MAKQDRSPPPWTPSMSDGCTLSLNKMPGGANLLPCCLDHDRAYHYGGNWLAKEMADRALRKCIKERGCYLCGLVAWYRFKALKVFGGLAWNWDGPGPPGKSTWSQSHTE